jgi:hypothetical protein
VHAEQIKNGDSKADVERLPGKPLMTMVVAGNKQACIYTKGLTMRLSGLFFHTHL